MKRWTHEEISTLKVMVEDNCSNSHMALILNRSRQSIVKALHRYELSRPVGSNQTYKHTEETKRKIAEKRKKYKMDNHPQWKGGRRLNHNGYMTVRMLEHPRAVNGYVFEHVLVMEEILGRHLEKEEVIHHLNENKTDNRPENLMLFKNESDHQKYHAFMRKEKIKCLIG